jgi:glutamate synthase (NADPH/NADH) large chain
MVLAPMASTGKEPVGSMGTDTPLAVLSDEAPPLFDYFHQLFAQVTNPPIDPIREALVMTLETNIGPDGNPFEETPEQCHRLASWWPVLTARRSWRRSARWRRGCFEPVTLSMLYRDGSAPRALRRRPSTRCEARGRARWTTAINLLVLTDRGVDAEHSVPIPCCWRCRRCTSTWCARASACRWAWWSRPADLREVHHIACLIGYGAAAVHPVAGAAIAAPWTRGAAGADRRGEAERLHRRRCTEGLLKVMSKMGISTLQSYRGAQIFEAVGLDRALVARTSRAPRRGWAGWGSPSWREVVARHERGFGPRRFEGRRAPAAGGRPVPAGAAGASTTQWNPRTRRRCCRRPCGRRRGASPSTSAVRRRPPIAATLRSCSSWWGRPPMPLDEVEPASRHRAALRHRRDELRVDQRRGPRDPGHRDEPPRRRSTAARAARSRTATCPTNGDSCAAARSSRWRRAASASRPSTWSTPTSCRSRWRRAPSRARAGSSRAQGRRAHRQGAPLDAGRDADLAAAAPRHLLDRGPGAAHLRPEVGQPAARISVKLVARSGVGTVAAGVAKAGADVPS